MKAYLVQRAKFQNRDYKTGIDSILSFDYMGSSEFEWGALPESLERIRENINVYRYSEISIQNKLVTVFCKESQLGEIEQYLNNLASGEVALKEFSGFDDYIKSKGSFKNEFDFWWDIDNDVMFWKTNVEFELKFKKTIYNNPKPSC